MLFWHTFNFIFLEKFPWFEQTNTITLKNAITWKRILKQHVATFLYKQVLIIIFKEVIQQTKFFLTKVLNSWAVYYVNLD